MRRLLQALVALTLLAAACDDGPHKTYVRAEKALQDTMARTGDLSYEHPDFDQVETLFRAVPESADEHSVAMLLADQIHEARRDASKRERRLAAEKKRLEGLEAKAEAEARARFHASDGNERPERPSDVSDESGKNAQPDAVERLEKVQAMRHDRIRRLDEKERAKNDNRSGKGPAPGAQ